MRFAALAVGLFTVLPSVDAAPQAYGFLPFFGPPRPVPGPRVTVPPPVRAPQGPAPAPAIVQPYQPANSGSTLPVSPNPIAAIPSPDPTVATPTSAPVFSPLPPTSNPGNTAPAVPVYSCAADVDRLASGIQQNILDQQGELVTAQGLLLFLQAAANGTRNGNATAVGNATNFTSGSDKNVGLFMALKGQLLAFVTAGIAIRTGNQAIAPSASLAASGLAQIANAQQTELALVSSLTGDATIDVATIQSLLTAFNGGVRLNMQNLLDATQHCTPTDLIAQRGVQVALRAGLKAVLPVSVPTCSPDATIAGNARRVRRGAAYNYE